MKRTPAEKKRLAALFRRAADIMADPRRCRHGCCRAIEKAQDGSRYESPEHDVFKAAFHFCAAMVEAGDL